MGADLWRDIWRLIDAHLHEGAFEMRWVKAHTGLGAVSAGQVTLREHQLNTLADTHAGYGSDAAVALSPNEQDVADYRRNKSFYRCLARLCADWPEDYVQDRLRPERAPVVARDPAVAIVHPVRPHEPWKLVDGRGACARCGVETRVGRGPDPSSFFRGACRVEPPAGPAEGGDPKWRTIWASRRDLVDRGALMLHTAKGKAKAKAKAAPAAGVAVRGSMDSFMVPFVSLLDLRASSMKPLQGGSSG